MLRRPRKVRIDTERLTLRPLTHGDFNAWTELRAASRDFLTPWEPTWAADHLTRKGFTNRVYWANRSVSAMTAMPLFLIRRADSTLVGAITLDNIRRGPAQSGTLGYWTGQPFARQGYMAEAIAAASDTRARPSDSMRSANTTGEADMFGSPSEFWLANT